MNLAIVKTRVQCGMQAIPVTVEVHLSNGLPCFAMVGLPETVVKESRERVRSAILNSQFEFPDGRITVNLAPADIPKEGGRFDLPIALGILIASMQIKGHLLEEYEFAGELALNGEIRPIQAALPFAYACAQAQKSAVLPHYNCQDAGLIQGIQLYSASTLLDVCAHMQGHSPLPLWNYTAPIYTDPEAEDLADIVGQTQAKRALIIAAAGGHHLLMQGPPGTGKTMLASRLPGILPPMTDTEAIEAASLYSIRGHKLSPQSFYQRPFRRPHHTSSGVALVGGGSIPKPGEISLAHKGVLFLDELPEFDRKVLEVLREPLETGVIHISRARDQIEFPADFQLIAAMNPCPCGYLGSTRRPCRCKPEQVMRYQNKLSGPLLDRIDLHVRLGDMDYEELLEKPKVLSETSSAIQKRVVNCRKLQLERQGVINAQLKNKALEEHCALKPAEQKILLSAMRDLQLSPRATHRLMRISRTIADLDHSPQIEMPHLSEALSYRA
jgi:magnesium chelatase family protein